MAELPDDIWGVIAKYLLAGTELAPVSRRLYSITARALEDHSSDYVSVELESVRVDVGGTYMYVFRDRDPGGHYDVNLHGKKCCRFDVTDCGWSTQVGIGTLGGSLMYRAIDMPLTPLACNFFLSKICNSYISASYPEHVRDYAGGVLAAAMMQKN